MWIFGYGSLIWKADFPYARKIAGYIKGYNRRFYQASTDHRGVPDKPGRVVTLLPSDDPESIVWGVVYEIKQEDVDRVLDQLDFRERCGYDKVSLRFYPAVQEPGIPSHVFTYISPESPANKWYAGEAELSELALVISEAAGPSGTNVDYLFKLAEATRTIAPHYNDLHLFSLETLVKDILAERSQTA